jgi:hypothetical protein
MSPSSIGSSGGASPLSPKKTLHSCATVIVHSFVSQRLRTSLQRTRGRSTFCEKQDQHLRGSKGGVAPAYSFGEVCTADPKGLLSAFTPPQIASTKACAAAGLISNHSIPGASLTCLPCSFRA